MYKEMIFIAHISEFKAYSRQVSATHILKNEQIIFLSKDD